MQPAAVITVMFNDFKAHIDYYKMTYYHDYIDYLYRLLSLKHIGLFI